MAANNEWEGGGGSLACTEDNVVVAGQYSVVHSLLVNDKPLPKKVRAMFSCNYYIQWVVI